MYAYICVCMYAWMYVCICMHYAISTYTFRYVYRQTLYMYICTYYIDTCILTCICILMGIHVHRQTCISIHVFMHTLEIHILDIYMFVYIHICKDAFIHECIYAYMYVGRHIYIYICKYIHTLHTCMKKYMCIYAWPYLYMYVSTHA